MFSTFEVIIGLLVSCFITKYIAIKTVIKYKLCQVLKRKLGVPGRAHYVSKLRLSVTFAIAKGKMQAQQFAHRAFACPL